MASLRGVAREKLEIRGEILMALTPEEVINKRFQATKFKEGYNPEEVDDFLDEIVIELRRLNAENASLKRQVEEAESRATDASVGEGQDLFVESDSVVMPAVAGDEATTGSVPTADPSSAASLLAMAQKVHDEYVAEGQREKERLLSEGREEAENLLSSAQEERSRVLGDLVDTKSELEGSVEQLRGFEQKYREGLRDYIESQLTRLKTGTTVEQSLDTDLSASSTETETQNSDSPQTGATKTGWLNR